MRSLFQRSRSGVGRFGRIFTAAWLVCLLWPETFPNIQPGPPPVRGRVRAGETLSELLGRLRVIPEERRGVVEAAARAWDPNQLRAGNRYQVRWDDGGTLQQFEYEIDEVSRLVVERKEEGLIATRVEIPYEVSEANLVAAVETSLWDAITAVGESPQLAVSFAEIFEWDVDFRSDLRRGDGIRIIYEERRWEGERAGPGRILAAKLSAEAGERTAIFFAGDRRGGGYYTPDGRALRKSFLRSPLRYRYISSGFSHRRLHPILRVWRPHLGIDYAAPAGTPVATVADGRVAFAGWRGESGRLVVIAHARGARSYYSHLSRIAPGIRPGARVKQGEVIGYVGSTGLSTGPHLDYRLQIRGRFVNPLTVANVEGPGLPEEKRDEFLELARGMVQRLADAGAAGVPTHARGG